MTESLFGFDKPDIAPLTEEAVRAVVEFCKPAFGCSKWVASRGGERPYYFNLDKQYADPSSAETRAFHGALAQYLTQVASADRFRFLLRDAEPVVALVCPEGGPAGIVQARGALVEHLGWPSVLVYPDKRLLRQRVIPGNGRKNFPESVRWLVDKPVFLISDAATTGESFARATGALRAFRARPIAAIAVYNRDEGAEESLSTINMPLYALFGPADAIEFGQFDAELRNKIAGGRKEIRDFARVAAQAG